MVRSFLADPEIALKQMSRKALPATPSAEVYQQQLNLSVVGC